MAQDSGEPEGREAAAPEVRFLKALVTGLTVVMALGMIAIVTIMWQRLGRPPLPDLPAAITLPDGAQAAAVTFARDRIVVLTDSEEVLVYDRAGRPLGRVPLN